MAITLKYMKEIMMMKTSTAEKHGYICPKCRDELAEDHQGRGYVKHKTTPNCDFEKGEKDDEVSFSLGDAGTSITL